MTRPRVLFVCVHNAGRSQMAAAWLRHLAGDAVEVRSAGSEPADQINPVAVEAMREVGIDITAEQPRQSAPDTVLQRPSLGRQSADHPVFETPLRDGSGSSSMSWSAVTSADTVFRQVVQESRCASARVRTVSGSMSSASSAA
jgi:Low molecular weight phosphotyrosine protein phosphatase